MHFETHHNEIKCVLSIKKSNFNGKKMGQNFHIFLKCVLSIKESNFNGKYGSKFSHLLRVKAEGADPPPYGQPDRKISIFTTNRK